MSRSRPTANLRNSFETHTSRQSTTPVNIATANGTVEALFRSKRRGCNLSSQFYFFKKNLLAMPNDRGFDSTSENPAS